MKFIRDMTEEERIQEIAELLATAALRHLNGQNSSVRSHQGITVRAVTQVWDLVVDEGEKQLLRYLSQKVAAAPGDIEKALNLSNRTLNRRLARLRELGLVAVSGKTRNATYTLAADISPPPAHDFDKGRFEIAAIRRAPTCDALALHIERCPFVALSDSRYTAIGYGFHPSEPGPWPRSSWDALRIKR